MPQDTETKIAELERQVEELKRAQLQYPLDPRNKRVIHQDLPVVKSISGNDWTLEVNDVEHLLTFGGGAAVCTTITVGPASNADSAGYDYVTDGTADDVQIQAAIDALPATGGKVILREGTYTIDYVNGVAAEIVSSKNGVHLMGMGRGTILTFENGFGELARMFDLTGAYCKITDIYFNGNRANGPGTSYDSSHVVTVGTESEVTGCYFVDMWGTALKVGAHSIVKDNMFIDCDAQDLATSDRPIMRTGNLCVVVGNVISLGADFIGASSNIEYIYAGAFCSIRANICILPDEYFGDVITASNGSAITSNIIRNSSPSLGDAFIRGILTGSNCVVTGNTISGGGGDSDFDSVGISLGNVRSVASGNTITGINGDGVYMVGDYCVAGGNSISSCGAFGIYAPGDYSSIGGNAIRNVGQATNDTYSGIAISSSSSYSTFVGNTVHSGATNKHKYGIREEGASSPSVIGDNVLRNAVTANLSTQSGSTVTSNNITA